MKNKVATYSTPSHVAYPCKVCVGKYMAVRIHLLLSCPDIHLFGDFMYKVIVRRIICCTQNFIKTKCALMEFETELPFTPFQGLTLKNIPGVEDNICLDDIRYDFKDSCFICYSIYNEKDADSQLYYGIAGKHIHNASIDKVISSYVLNGWKLIKEVD